MWFMFALSSFVERREVRKPNFYMGIVMLFDTESPAVTEIKHES
jgi:hypothetical protein